MLDLKFIRENPEEINKALAKKKFPPEPINQILKLDEKHRDIMTQTEELQAQVNKLSKEIPQADTNQKITLLEKSKQLKEELKKLEPELSQIEEEQNKILFVIPNIPHESVPEGIDENDNIELKKWGKPAEIKNPKNHVDLGTKLGILNLDRAAKIAGARFSILKGAGARLERALATFMLEHQTNAGYEEIIPPYLVNSESMFSTGQLPKFEEDLFKTSAGNNTFYLIPTGEVPLINLYRDEILDKKLLPINNCALTPCFRSEAGSYGKDTKGIIRQHQFHKVELVKFTTAEQAEEELEKLTRNAEEILEKLELPYRRVILCGGDIGFHAHKTYDLEVWIPSQNKYREISSCSWCSDFQGRRAKIRYKDNTNPKTKTQFVHTLNGSGLALGRTWVAIIENYQQPDGSILIPEILRPYMEGINIITSHSSTTSP